MAPGGAVSNQDNGFADTIIVQQIKIEHVAYTFSSHSSRVFPPVFPPWMVLAQGQLGELEFFARRPEVPPERQE
jgi:hypothetical protein